MSGFVLYGVVLSIVVLRACVVMVLCCVVLCSAILDRYWRAICDRKSDVIRESGSLIAGDL